MNDLDAIFYDILEVLQCSTTYKQELDLRYLLSDFFLKSRDHTINPNVFVEFIDFYLHNKRRWE